MQTLPSAGVMTLINEAYGAVVGHIQSAGDGLLTGGLFQWTTDTGFVLQAWSTNNHQTTWGVLGAAVTALGNYMTTSNIYGSLTFYIYDGVNEVGAGQIGPAA